MAEEHSHEEEGGFGELGFAIACGASLAIGFALETLTSVPPVVPLGLYILAYGLGGFFTLKEAAESLRHGKFQIDTLMLVAAAGAATLGQWTEGALLLFLFSLGHALEHYAM